MSEININKLKGQEKLLAYSIDKEGKRGFLDTKNEISIFNDFINSDSESIVNNHNIKNIVDDVVQKEESIRDFFLQKFPFNKTNKTNEIKNLILMEAKRRDVPVEKVDIEYWCSMVEEFSEKYHMSSKLIAAIMAQETNGKFDKNIDSDSGAGPMQVTEDTTEDLYQEYRINAVYKLMSPDLYDEIMYIKDANGNKTLRCKTHTKLRNACTEDDRLGMQVGILCFQEKYAAVVAKKKGLTLISAIKQLKDGSLVLTPEEQKDCIRKALEKYNGNPNKQTRKEYARNICDSLLTSNFDYSNVKVLAPFM